MLEHTNFAINENARIQKRKRISSLDHLKWKSTYHDEEKKFTNAYVAGDGDDVANLDWAHELRVQIRDGAWIPWGVRECKDTQLD
jgi:hypothetical protein